MTHAIWQATWWHDPWPFLGCTATMLLGLQYASSLRPRKALRFIVVMCVFFVSSMMDCRVVEAGIALGFVFICAAIVASAAWVLTLQLGRAVRCLYYSAKYDFEEFLPISTTEAIIAARKKTAKDNRGISIAKPSGEQPTDRSVSAIGGDKQ